MAICIYYTTELKLLHSILDLCHIQPDNFSFRKGNIHQCRRHIDQLTCMLRKEKHNPHSFLHLSMPEKMMLANNFGYRVWNINSTHLQSNMKDKCIHYCLCMFYSSNSTHLLLHNLSYTKTVLHRSNYLQNCMRIYHW